MKLFDSGFDLGGGALAGAGAVVLAPIVLPLVASGLKSLTKATIKGGFLAYHKVRLATAETWEGFEDLVAEAKAETIQTPGKQESKNE